MAKYALIIGVDLYKDDDFLQELNYAYNDATRIHDFFLLSGYKSIPLYGPHANCDMIVRKLESVCKKLKSGDTFLFYFSGHGFQTNSKQYILPYDSQTWAISKKGGNAISLEFIDEATRTEGVERILIIDACRKSLEKDKGGLSKINELNSKAIRGALQQAPSTSPISILCSCSPGQRSYEFKELGGGVFSEALLRAFEYRILNGIEISLPDIADYVQKIVQILLDKYSPHQLQQTPFIYGARTVILPRGNSTAHHSSTLSPTQERAKKDALSTLQQLLSDHALWLDSKMTDTGNQLTWEKLRPIFDVYRQAGLGNPDLAGANMKSADFSKVRILKGISFSQALLSSASFAASNLSEVDFSGCNMTDGNFCYAEARRCDFSDTILEDIDFSDSELLNCKFDDSLANDTDFRDSKLKGSSFKNASLITSNFSDSLALNTDFTEADLTASTLIQTDLSGATLTGVHLYGTARSDWKIERVKCRYVYWDKHGKERFPPEQDFLEKEFIDQCRDYSSFSYTFADGMTPLDLILATHIVDEINNSNDDFRIKIDNASVRGLNPTINFIMESGENKKDKAAKQFKIEYEQKVAMLETLIQQKEMVLTERSKRLELAENQLATMNILVQKTTRDNASTTNARAALSSMLVEPLMSMLEVAEKLNQDTPAKTSNS